ncbi:tyrosine-type recombinase/integrase [Bowmanella yangjiangensis]|uniref:Tyrosine-type recombinase/integrase n=1 Tax=Bowmanella yangjiangensis TaxID=2811230 RepID=A0ABS3CQG3_9ALTE|nr:tyrosine-type recombinase/integrase [Bowmanella yangjiangensis]MBN7819334.1 tyrosine-type recombinase/integrase [Bowmanella yangjiangensis]
MKDLIARYMQEVSPTKAPETHKSNMSGAKFLLLSFGDFRPKEVKPIHIYQHLDARKKSATRANREVALLGAIFTEAIRWGIVEETPVQNIKRHKEIPRDRLVTDNEIKAFKHFAPEWMRLYIDLKLSTALRQTDMLRLHSGMWDEKGLWVDTSKTGKKLCFSASSELKLIVSKLQKINSVKKKSNVLPLNWWFFSTRSGTPYSADGFRSIWHRVMNKALSSGLLEERFQEKDLRARAATDCNSLMEAFELCGHSSLSTTKRIYRRGYTHVHPVNRAKSLKKK